MGVILPGYFPRCEFSELELSGGNYRGGNFPGGSFHVTTWERRCHKSCVCRHLHHFLSFWQLFFIVSCFISRNLALPLFKKDVFVRNDYFSPSRLIPVVMKEAFFT